MCFPDISLERLSKELFLTEEELSRIASEKNWILFFSGGADSVLCLIFLLLIHRDYQNTQNTKEKRQLIVYYLDHGQSFNTSDVLRRKTVFKECHKLLRDFDELYDLQSIWRVSEKKNIQKIAKRLKLSFEYAGAKVRSKAMVRLSNEYHGCVISGHHLSDWYETLLMRLNRGSSLAKLMPFGFFEIKSIGLRKYHPLFLAFRHEIRSILRKYKVSYWDDPGNEDETILRNLIRKNYPVRNDSGLRKTAQNLLTAKEKQNSQYNFNFSHEVIVEKREVRIPYFEERSKKLHTKILHRQEILRYLGLGALSGKNQKKVCDDFFYLSPYQIEIENWNNQWYTVFRRGRSTLQKIQTRTSHALENFLKNCGSPELYIEYPAAKVTKSHKINFAYGRKSVKDLFKEKKISERQKKNIAILIEKDNLKKVVFLPLSVFGLTDIRSYSQKAEKQNYSFHQNDWRNQL